MRTTRFASSLIELLVAIAILGILVGLLLSAVQQVRLAAARLSCTNNLKQLALALHSHHESMGAFPAGCRSDTRTEPMPYLSWRSAILPYLEQQPLWDAATSAYRVDRSPFSDRHTPRVQPQKVFSCPLDDRLTTAWDVTTTFHTRVRTALSSYLAVSGTTSTARDGIFFTDSHTQLLHVSDGTSNTLLLGERPPSTDLVYGWWYAGTGQARSGQVDSHLGTTERNLLGMTYRKYWSFHSGGAHFAFADGSVRFIRYEAATILPHLATRAGGEIASLN
jgi:prepilin-type processing-associated H-X9-DG protein